MLNKYKVLKMRCNTMNVDIFALYIFLRNSRFSKVRENVYSLKITFTIIFLGNIMKNVNFNPR